MPSCRYEIATRNVLEANIKASRVVSQDDTTHDDTMRRQKFPTSVVQKYIVSVDGMCGVSPVFLAKSYLPEGHQRTGMLEFEPRLSMAL